MALPRLLISFAALTALALATNACGGGDELTLEAYFQQLDSIFRNSDARLAEISADLDEAQQNDLSDADQAAAFREAFVRSNKVFEDAINELSDLDPPVEAAQAHVSFLEATVKIHELSQEIVDDLAGLETVDAIDAYFADRQAETSAATKRGDDTCLALQKIADDKRIDVDLACQD